MSEEEILCKDSNGWDVNWHPSEIPSELGGKSGVMEFVPKVIKRTMTYYMKRGNKYYFRNKTATFVAEITGDMPSELKYGIEVDVEMRPGYEPATTASATKKFREAMKRANKPIPTPPSAT